MSSTVLSILLVLFSSVLLNCHWIILFSNQEFLKLSEPWKMTLPVYNLLTHGHNLLTGTAGGAILHLNVIMWCYIKE